MQRTHAQTIALDALLVALLVASCFFTIPLGPVPFTLQTAVVILILLICNPQQTALICGIYVLMGTVGLPVFSGMSGGIMRASAGFLFGFIVGGALASALRMLLNSFNKFPTVVCDAIAAVVYMFIADVLGLIWYTFFAGVTFAEAFFIMVAPFIFVDCLKAVFALVAAKAVRASLHL